MDGSIRLLLHNCQSDNNPECLQEPYEKLKLESSENGRANVGTDLFVLCAEVACQQKKLEIAEDCIKMYLKLSPPGNQYLCRAYMCQAQIHAPTSTKNPEQIEKAVSFLLKAINFAKQNSRYHFLVYNASVLYWQFCRLFLKPNYKRFLAKTLHQVVKALDDIDDEDYEWRAQLMIALIECHIDAGRKDDASQIATMAAQFTRNNVPNLYKDVLGLQVQHRLTEYGKLSKETKSSPDLHLFFKIHRLKVQLAGEEKGDIGSDLAKFYKQLTGICETDVSGTSTEFSEKSTTNVTRFTTPVAMETNDRLSLVLELAKLCMSYGACRLASDCLDYVEKNSKESSVNLHVEFLRCELMVKALGEKQENYFQSVVQVRLEAIEKLEQYMMTALRFGDAQVIQIGCMTMWNLCLPLLQLNLRHHVRKPLTLIADALENVDSLNSLLRCEVHTELAKCEESEEQLEQAMLHLRKALSFDDDGIYTERLETLLRRIQLRATLYTTPERQEDVAAMIIEQARTSSNSGTSTMKRASLVKAGNALAPDAFAMVLESENESREISHGKQPPSLLTRLVARAEHFEKAVAKAAGHLKRLGTQDDQERVRIWAELTKTARKQQVWDVARVAARFCLLYDDGRWCLKRETRQTGEDEGGYAEEEKNNEGRSSSGSMKKGEGQAKKISFVTEEAKSNVERDLLRILAEVHFINAEALIQFLRRQGVLLCDSPTLPAPESLSSATPRETVGTTEDSPQWLIYCDWLKSLSQSVISEFQRASELGSELQEPWLVCNSAVYLLNYTTHLVAGHRHRELVTILSVILKNMRSVGHVGEGALLCQMCNILATGLMQPWYPSSASKTSLASLQPAGKKSEGKREKNVTKNVPKVTTTGFDADAISELKQALEYVDYALQVTNGNDIRNIVPISVRHSLIKTWVHCKQLLSQQIPKNFGVESEDANSQGPMSRCLCALEMLSVGLHGLNDFPAAPTLQEVVRMVGSCVWSDDAVSLEVWARLAVLSFNADNHTLLMECGKKALAFAELESREKRKDKNKTSVEHGGRMRQQLLYYACIIMGQSVVRVMKGQTKMRRDALGYFVKACRFGELAKSYDFVISAARHYWNTVIPLVSEPLERQLLKEPLEIVLRCLAAVSDKNLGKADDEDDEEEEIESVKKAGSSVKLKETKSKEKKGGKNEVSKKAGKTTADETKSGKTDKQELVKQPSSRSVVEPAVVNVYEEDLKMRAAMYGVLFQAYADQGEWEQGLQAMDDAVRDMPRTCHRLLIFKHRVITKAKLGKDVQFDMGKFKDESELVISSMWHHVALNSCTPREQLKAYQNAIDVLQEANSDWQKVDFLLELGEWLFVNEFPLQNAVDQFAKAVDILVNRSAADEHSEHDDVESEHGGSSPARRSSTSPCGGQLNKISDIKTLEYLTRIHIMLAQVVGRKCSDFTHYSFFAVACVQRLWKLSMDFLETSRDGAKPGDCTPTKKANKSKEKEGKSEKSCSKTCLPSSLRNWATFEVPEKFIEQFKNDECGKVISKTSFVRPALSVHYLNILLNDLCDCGYHHLCLPITSLLRCLAKHVIENELLLKLSHWRTMEICQELRLIDEAMQHERIAKDFENEKEEVARSREEIELWKEKQRQVKEEEESHFSEMMKSGEKRGESAGSRRNIVEHNNWMAGRKEIHQVERRELWVQQAAIFINQGYYQAARELLNEANTSALAFNDHRTRAEVFYNLALLAFRENNWQQSISLLQQLQNFKLRQGFWLKTVLLMVDAICGKRDKSDPQGTRVDIKGKSKAILVLQQSMSTFKTLFQDSPNKACRAEYVRAKLEAKLGAVIALDVLDDVKDSDMSYLVQACECLQSSEISLISCGHRQEAIDVKCERAAILRRLAARSKTKSDRRNFYLEALSVLRSAVRLSDVLSTQVVSMCSPSELGHVSLSVERASAGSKLCFGELAVEMLNDHAREEREKRNREARKGSVEKLIDAFVQEEPVMTEQEAKWKSITRSIVDETLVHLTAAFNQSASVPFLKAKCYLVLGQCLRTLASLLDPDDDPQWRLDQIAAASTAEQVQLQPTSIDEEGPCDNNSVDEELQQSSKDFKTASKRASVAKLLKVEYKNFQRTLTQAVESLASCVQLGLKHGYNDLVSEGSYLLMDIIGRHDMSTSSAYLTLYQSCSMVQTLRSLIERCQSDSSLSRLAALMRQRYFLAREFHHEDTVSTVFASNTQTLGEFEAWRRLSISRNHLELIKELSSPSTLYLVLQHSRDRSYLYAATLDKPRAGPLSGKPGKQANTSSVSAPKSIICRSKVDPDDLEKLLKSFERFRGDQATELIRQNYLRRHAEETKSMFTSVDDECLDTNKDVLHNDPTVKENEKHLEKQYLTFISEMESYLSSMLEQLRPALNEKEVPETVVIFADEYLLRLPLESLTILRSPNVQCLARDLSLQMHYHRFQSNEVSASEDKNDGKKAAVGAGKKPGKGEAPTTAKSQDKKGEKKVSKELGIPKDGIAVDISGLRYIVDPHNECSRDDNESPEKVLNDVLVKYRQLAAKWSGLVGKSHVASVGEWQRLMKESSVFIFHGTQKCLNYVPASLLVSLSLQECNVMLILDHVETNESFQRQSAIDTTKTRSELMLEFPFESAAILSLTGVNCVVANQWNCKLRENNEKFIKILEAAIDESKNIGNALRTFVSAKPDINSNASDVNEDISENGVILTTTQPNFTVLHNTILYGLPYFMLNPAKA